MTSTGTYRRCAILLSMLIWPAWAEERREPAELYPPMEPFERGHLKVGDIHEINIFPVCDLVKLREWRNLFIAIVCMTQIYCWCTRTYTHHISTGISVVASYNP